ncbi:hypothetical protein AOQ84DRAFT_375195 [Glonium stellatum]|uniref:Uncharacterized protein n=1 Tax=Glonium stellatum TaxID=574774 RepID=A0A8E2F401_9PEZI|nr:hypothetical protein AOQ84DRAFT_375195 [Glonium stellatum]
MRNRALGSLTFPSRPVAPGVERLPLSEPVTELTASSDEPIEQVHSVHRDRSDIEFGRLAQKYEQCREDAAKAAKAASQLGSEATVPPYRPPSIVSVCGARAIPERRLPRKAEEFSPRVMQARGPPPSTT